MTGHLKKSPKAEKKSFNIMETICCRAAKYFCSLGATQNLSRSPSLMLRLIYLHRFTSFGVILWGRKSCCCCICSFPSHFTQIRAHGRRDLLAIFWVFMKTLPHFQSTKTRPLICVSLRPRIRISHIPRRQQKARPLPKNVINISYCMQHRRMR